MITETSTEFWASRRSFIQRLQPVIFLSISLPSVPDIHGLLQPQPELRSRLEDAGESVRQVRINGAPFAQKLVDSATRHTEPGSQLRRSQSCKQEAFPRATTL